MRGLITGRPSLLKSGGTLLFDGSALLVALAFLGVSGVLRGAPNPTPNIVFILGDDLGYGDLGCYGSTKIKTPNLDRLAQQGMRFTNAHSPSAVCAPSRYNLLTGRYCWRIDLPANRRSQLAHWSKDRYMPKDGRYVGHVAVESNEPLMIEEGRPTIASFLKGAGYATACVGKWHLGFGRPGMPGWSDELGPDWNREIAPGPLEVGFDYYFGLPIVNGSQPKVFLENHRVVGLDPHDPIKLVTAYSPSGRLQFEAVGGKAARFDPAEIDGRNVEKAVGWIEKVAKDKRPFFLYLALTNPHGPFAPGPRFKGTSEVGPYGDAMHELDWRVGEIMACLDRLGLSAETLLIFASDNGSGMGSYQPGVDHSLDLKGHRPNAPWRGQKTEVYEGGQRVPFLARWPGRIAAGTENGALIALTDMFATACELVGRKVPAGGAEDSFSFLWSLLNTQPRQPVRRSLVTDSMLGLFAIQEGDWKLIEGPGGGGYFPRGPEWSENTSTESGQLYNLADDPGERRNLYLERPDKVAHLKAALMRIKSGSAK